MANQEFWQDKKRSEETLREVSSIKSAIEPIDRVSGLIDECGELVDLAEGDRLLSIARVIETEAEAEVPPEDAPGPPPAS